MDKNSPVTISTAVESMLRSGRLATQTGLDLQQVWIHGQWPISYHLKLPNVHSTMRMQLHGTQIYIHPVTSLEKIWNCVTWFSYGSSDEMIVLTFLTTDLYKWICLLFLLFLMRFLMGSFCSFSCVSLSVICAKVGFLFFIRGLVTLFKQRGSIICAFFLFSVLYIEELPLLVVAQQVCGSCFLSMCFDCQLSGNLHGFHSASSIFTYLFVYLILCTDHGVFFAQSTHLMGSHVGCWTTWPVLVVSQRSTKCFIFIGFVYFY